MKEARKRAWYVGPGGGFLGPEIRVKAAGLQDGPKFKGVLDRRFFKARDEAIRKPSGVPKCFGAVTSPRTAGLLPFILFYSFWFFNCICTLFFFFYVRHHQFCKLYSFLCPPVTGSFKKVIWHFLLLNLAPHWKQSYLIYLWLLWWSILYLI